MPHFLRTPPWQVTPLILLAVLASPLPAQETLPRIDLVSTRAMATAPLASIELASIELGPLNGDKAIEIRGPHARQQLLVTGRSTTGELTDQTRDVVYTTEPANIIEINADGKMSPLRDGLVSVTASSTGGLKSTLDVVVKGCDSPNSIHFRDQVVPTFFKLKCSSGGCHGKAAGQNGFKLSLMGFYADDDYEFLVKEGRGRRLFPSSPDESLLLTKALGLSHRGGKRMEKESDEYQLIRDWVDQAMPAGDPTAPHVVSIKCYPERRTMKRLTDQQITTLAIYSDGSTKDVTHAAVYESNDTEMAEVSSTGLVESQTQTGEVAIMALYQGEVATFRAVIPLGADTQNIPKPRNVIDDAVFAKLKMLGIPTSQRSDDATFLRRVSIDITGTIPTDDQVASFLANQDPNKRDQLIDQLLDSPQYADYFANKWNLLLRNKKRATQDLAGTYGFHRWIWTSLYDNKPYDQLASQIVTASGEASFNPAVVWYREVDQSEKQGEDVAQLFLGLRIQCAKCHHHPYERWSEDDYYSFTAFFSRIGKKNIRGASRQVRDKRIYHNEGLAQARNPRTNAMLRPSGLGDDPLEIANDLDPRVSLAKWMVDKENPFFAPALVNRYWKHFFNRGIVEPEDDMRATNPPSNPELLERLSEQFIDSGFDLKELVRTICQSETYQLSSIPNPSNVTDRQNYSRYYPKRLTAEVLYDAFHQVTKTGQNFTGIPAGTTSIQLADASVSPYFLTVFGQPAGDSACECERQQVANLAQSLHLLNSTEIQEKISKEGGRAALLSADDRTDSARIRELYRAVFAREPNKDEIANSIEYVKSHHANPRQAYEDLVWALINTNEFLFNH